MTNPDALTRPEGYVEKRDRRRITAMVVRDGGCAWCLLRGEHLGWERYVCSEGLVFPFCTKGRRPKFELDETKVKGATSGNR